MLGCRVVQRQIHSGNPLALQISISTLDNPTSQHWTTAEATLFRQSSGNIDGLVPVVQRQIHSGNPLALQISISTLDNLTSQHWTTTEAPSCASRAAILTDSYRLSNVKFTRTIRLHCKSQFRHWTTRHPNIGQPQKPPSSAGRAAIDGLVPVVQRQIHAAIRCSSRYLVLELIGETLFETQVPSA